MPLELHSIFLFALERFKGLREWLNELTQERSLVRWWAYFEMVLALWFCDPAEFEIWVRRGRRPSKSGTLRRSNCVFIPPSGLRIRFADYGGGGGIRTHGTLRLSGFQDRRNRPLCHPSFVIIISSLISQAYRLEYCSLPIYCQLSEIPAIQCANN